MRRSRRLIIWIATLLLVGGCFYNCWKSFDPTIGHADTADEGPIKGLPHSATNIRYFLPGSFGPVMAYEFDVKENNFETWVAGLPPPKLTPSKSREIRCQGPSGWPTDLREILDGPIYSWQYEDQAVVTAFDRHTGRAFYYRSYR